MHDKLVKIQQELKAPKNRVNKFGNYKYRSCEDILEAVKPLLHREGLFLTISDEIVNIGGKNYVKATATIWGDRGDSPSYLAPYWPITAYAREEEAKKGMDAAQMTGSASSYARKYALNGLFAIDDNADPDATNTHGKEEKKDYPQPATLEDEIAFD